MKNSPIKIMFILPSLKAGGAERVMSFVASHLDKNKFDTSMLVVGFEKDKVFDISGINIIYLNKKRLALSIFSVIKTIRHYKPNIVIGSIGHINTMLALISLLFRKTKFVGRESSVSSTREKYNSKRSLVFDILGKKRFTMLDAVICQSQDMLNDIKERNAIDESKFRIINNPITKEPPVKIKKSTNKVKQLITIGRLGKVKGYERLLKLVVQLEFDWHYTIIGNGIEKESLFKLAKDLNIMDKIQHIEHTSNVYQYLSESDLFLQGSYVEGFPNALLESCSIGTPVIAFNAPGGTKEIIEPEINGYMANNEKDFIKYVNTALFEKEWSPEEVSNSVKSKFSKHVILSKYEALFYDLLKNGQKD